ncbi:hypothetical protein LTR62_001625 [Meristemomyces frigidus]|uniref:Uncharacterized protein n=1 Tax=Meristemomyces frigidus TaxID=1508187 RepID=A0AAN7T954_9PEZI|nr:hypothetical protein LTR62_001625 [Meristemomyces frigidus]
MRTDTAVGLLAITNALYGAVHAGPVSRSHPTSSTGSIENMKSKIKNVVILVMENRSFDNLLGGQKTKGLENPINNGPFCNPINITNPSAGRMCSRASDYNSVIDDPDHNVYGNNIEFYGTYNPDNNAIASGKLQPNMQGFIHEEIHNYATKGNSSFLAKQVMNYYTEEQVAVLTALTKNFVTFNHWHSDVPGPTNPNRVALHSGTTHGYGANNFENGVMPQMSIFEQMSALNKTWKNYVTLNTSITDALFFNWTYASGSGQYVVPLADYYTDAAAGELPELSVVNPSCCDVGTTSMHPSGLVSDGENLIKAVYEALRASPQWNQSALLITFDETGGFHDHVQPPLAVRPDNFTYTTTTPSGTNYTFGFDRLGGRLPTWLISPWVSQGYVEQKGVNCDGKEASYSATSMLRTLGYLWDFQPFNPRVEKAPSFDRLFGKSIRTDVVEKLPNVTACTAPLSTPPRGSAVFSDEPARASSPPSSPPGFPWEKEAVSRTSSPKPTVNIFSMLGKRKALANVGDNVRPTKKPATSSQRPESKSLTQMQISLGQEVQTTCRVCGMEYIRSSAEDRKLHDKYHKQNTEGYDVGKDFVQKASEGVSFQGAAAGDTICMVDCFDRPGRKSRAQAVLEIVQRELGAVPIAAKELWDKNCGALMDGTTCEPRYSAYMYIRGTKCVGYLLTERITRAACVQEPESSRKKTAASREPALPSGTALSTLKARKQAAQEAVAEAVKHPIELSPETSGAKLGISRIWTSPTHRQQGIGIVLLNAALRHYNTRSTRQTAAEIGKEDVAFSQPTAAGARLARKWFGRLYGWHVYVD